MVQYRHLFKRQKRANNDKDKERLKQMVRTYCAIGVWVLIGVLTYIYIRFGNFGKNVYQYNLKCEGSSSDAIHIFCILFGIFWPLWWVFMHPILILIGRHDEKWFECQRRLRGK